MSLKTRPDQDGELQNGTVVHRGEPGDDAGRVQAVARPRVHPRAGVSAWSVLSGVLVAFGAFVLLAAVVGAILAATGVAEGGITPSEAADASLGAGIGLVVAQLLAYLWGGYTAGRMARGSGPLNGLLVALTALVLMGAVGALVAALTGNTTAAEASRSFERLPFAVGRLSDIGTGVGIGALAAMVIGGTLGGWLGVRWHSKLENRAPASM